MTIALHGQVAIVTGAGRGMGRAHSLELARRGAAVVVNDVVREYADAVVAEIIAVGGSAAPSYDSVTSKEGGACIVAAALDHFGTVDVVINNAGFMRNAYFEEQTPEMLADVLDVHIGGAFWVTQAAWPVMRAKGYGRVVMVGSGGGLFAMHGLANYAAAKAGIYGLSKALAFEGKPIGIFVNTVLPSAKTTINLHTPLPHAENWVGMGEAVQARRLPEAVSAMVVYLASRDCEFTGEMFDAKAGVYARVFIGVAPGWVAPDVNAVTAEDIASHLDAIREQTGYEVPEDNGAALALLARKVSSV